MKKMVSIVAIFLVLFLITYTINSYAETIQKELTTLQITTDKETVHPNETVTLNIAFGTNLGAYTANVVYDANVLDYVSAEGGEASNSGGKVIVTYAYKQVEGQSPRNSMSITFKAKGKDIIKATNPTSLRVSLDGLANPDASIEYNVPTSETIKNLVVEPNYEDYQIALNYTGDILVNEEKEMEIMISSSMGRNYKKTRLLASVVAPEGQHMQLLANKDEDEQYDIIESGWGNEQGDSLGGENVAKTIQARGIFSGEGTYSLTLKVINREDRDSVIASKTFEIKVGETTPKPQPETDTTVPPATNNNQTPQTLPKTGNMIYVSIIPIIAILAISYILLRKKN